MKVALTSSTPQIFDRLHKDHAHRMWVLEERQVLAQEAEQRVAKALQGRTVTVGSAAEVRAAGHRLYDEALRSRERLEAKRRQQRDAEALEDLQRAQKPSRAANAVEPRWEQLYAGANQKKQRLAEKRLLQELEEEHWMNYHDLHRGVEEGIAHERLYQDAMQRGERLFIKEQRKLAEESKQLSQGIQGVHGKMTLGSDFASRIAEQRSQFLYEDARQRKERLETKIELEQELRREHSAPILRSRARSERSQTPRNGRGPSGNVQNAVDVTVSKAPNVFDVLRPESPGARKLLQAASRNKMQSAVMSQMLMSKVVHAFGPAP